MYIVATFSLFMAAPLVAQEQIENVHRLSDSIWSGSSPETDADFAAIEKLGAKVVVSVDGAKPQVEAAAKRGLRYVHIPIGYDGADRTAQLAVIRLMQESKGPFYFHCHHGKHRGPTMAAMAGLANGSLDRIAALKSMSTAGTSPDYQGLWRTIRTWSPAKEGEELPKLVEVAEPTKFAKHMSQAEKLYKKLEKLPQSGDKESIETAALLYQSLAEASRLPKAVADREMQMAFDRAIHATAEMRSAVKEKRVTPATWAAITKSCVACHADFR